MSEAAGFTSWQILLVIIVPSLIASIPSIVSALLARKSSRMQAAEASDAEATAAEKVAAAYDKVVDDLQTRITKTEERTLKTEQLMEQRATECFARIDAMQKRILYLEDGIRLLVGQIRSMKGEPLFTLENEKTTPREPRHTKVEADGTV